MRIDDNTLKRAILSSTVTMVDAYSVTKGVTRDRAKVEVYATLVKDLAKLLDQPYVGSVIREKVLKIVNSLIKEYDGKQDKAYTALFTLKEVITG